MEQIQCKLDKLSINTAGQSTPTFTTWSDEESTDGGDQWDVSQQSELAKRYSFTDPDCSPEEPNFKQQHKRSISVGTPIVLPPRNQSVPDLKHSATLDSKYLLGNHSSPKKKWFQLPRIALKRQQSTPPRRGYGGLKAGTVEPPEPPPQLLFNLDWSTTPKRPSGLWENDVSSVSTSTPVSPIVSRRASSNCLDLPLSSADSLGKRHQKSSSLSSTSTIVADDEFINGSTADQDSNDNSAHTTDIKITRRQSCPLYQDGFFGEEQVASVIPSDDDSNTSTASTTSSKRLFPKIPVSSIHKRPILKRGVSSESILSTSLSSPATTTVSSYSTISSIKTRSPRGSSSDLKLLLFNVYAPDTDELVLNFRHIKPRTTKLRRRTNPKAERKALHEWQNQLLSSLSKCFPLQRANVISPVKKARYYLTRQFILREFYITEINFWNQLNFTKVMFCDPLRLALEKGSVLARPVDLDWFANLQDLMSFSSTLIWRLRQFNLDKHHDSVSEKLAAIEANYQEDDVNIGLILREMAESMVIFLRCALDYKANKKAMDQRMNNKGYMLYKEKLALRKETRQFTLHDYLIIPIQRVTRYGLLLTDLAKHTETTHPDYKNIRIALCIVQSLAATMNHVQS